MVNVTMSPKEIFVYYIDLCFSIGINDLLKENFTVTLNGNYFYDFSLEKLTIDGTLYRLRPYNFLNIYDELRLQVNKPPYTINDLRLYISKYLYNGNALFLYEIPQIPSGVYNTTITSISDFDFTIKSDPVTICNGISPISSISTDKTIYTLGEDIIGHITLFDNDNLKAPDGTYIVKIAIEKLN